ncbi:hypothetical protein FRC14_004493, partial [Serendipita sp. 396]
MQSSTMDWTNPMMGPFPVFESPPNSALQQLPITLPPSSYDPTFGNTMQFLGTSAAYSSLTNNMSTSQVMSPFHEDFGHHFVGDSTSTNNVHVQNARSSPNLWGGFALTPSFSSLDGQSGGVYAGPVTLDGPDDSFQCIRFHSRQSFPFVPIFDNGGPADSVLVPEPDLLTSTTLYPHQAMPLTIQHPELSPKHPEQPQLAPSPSTHELQYSQPTTANFQGSEDQAWALPMENVTKMEKTQNVDPQKLVASAPQQQTALNLPVHQSQTNPFAYQQPTTLLQQQQRLLEHEQDLAQRLLLEQQRFMQLRPNRRSSPKQESPPNRTVPRLSPPDTPLTSGDVYQETTSIHDFMAEDRLNIGAKENQLLPSGLPSVPSLSVRTPAPRPHPYSSPRLTGVMSPRGQGSSMERKGSIRSVRPVIPRVGLSLKRDSLSSTTAYIANLRRPIPSLAMAMSALERTPIDPYGRATVTPFGSTNFGYGFATNGNGIPGSASTTAISLPPESPLPSTSTVLESPSTQRMSIVGLPPSPLKELTSPMGPTENSLRLHRGGSVGAQPRPSTASTTSTVDMRSSPPPYGSPVQGSSDRVQSQTRATASRKRADDEILGHSFRSDGEWRQRAVLENVLSAS